MIIAVNRSDLTTFCKSMSVLLAVVFVALSLYMAFGSVAPKWQNITSITMVIIALLWLCCAIYVSVNELKKRNSVLQNADSTPQPTNDKEQVIKSSLKDKFFSSLYFISALAVPFYTFIFMSEAIFEVFFDNFIMLCGLAGAAFLSAKSISSIRLRNYVERIAIWVMLTLLCHLMIASVLYNILIIVNREA